ncbi:CRISPR-associated helicase Cas3' [Streptomyces sp. NPDC058279]|uniref:CRISPR-associated helicase Cas3' n=1 Tax=Streptomyces sp. NPDC058279 TaxID=3346418 RepID=UPI0036EA78A7
MPEVDQSLWGKARGLEGMTYPVVRHLLDAAAMALTLWDEYLTDNQRAVISAGFGCVGRPDEARALVGLCAGLHDLGKISGFQFCNRRAAEGLSAGLLGDLGKIGDEQVRHDVAGMRATAAVLAALGFEDVSDPDDEKGPIARIAEVIGGHHGRFHRHESLFDSPAYEVFLGGGTWAGQRSAHARAIHAVLGAPTMPDKFAAPAAVLVTGVVVLADWLVSQESYVRERCGSLEVGLERHFAQSCVDAKRLVRDAGLMPVELARKPFAEAYGIDGAPNALQRSLASDLPVALEGAPQEKGAVGKAGILVVTAAPGDGKSEAALEAERVLSSRFGTRGFAFLLPTMATSDQMHGRVAGVLARQEAAGSGLALTHSMSWLNNAYAEDGLGPGDRVLVCDGDEAGQDDGPARRLAALRPARWLRGAKRALLAQYAVGTIDQALMAVLPVRHSMLRLLGLSGKTFIVDEAHAYDPYMQVLLGRLLNWLGAYGVPVVLLSATLPGSVSDQLVKQYLQGAGLTPKSLKARSFPVPYPGWLYVDAGSGHCTEISAADREEQARQRRMDLVVEVEPVDGSRPDGARGRLAVIGRLVTPALEEGAGCVLVVCNTVGEAQDTYTYLCELSAGRLEAGSVQLLHARFPAKMREARTRQVTGGMGRSGPRPQGRIIVATQVVEQSLDLDADVVISDLAPMALLLQRAGRCWRHETWWAEHGRPDGKDRPGWALQTGPRLVVLDPLSGGGGVPRQWGEVYHEAVLFETSQALAERGVEPVRVPDDVQELVEGVHGVGSGRYNFDNPEASAAWSAYVGQEAAHRGAGNMVVIPRARSVIGLDELHRTPGTDDEWQAATRLGADSVRLLCVYVHDGGRESLDLAGEIPLPCAAAGEAPTATDVRLVMGQTIPVNAQWFRDVDGGDFQPPPAWMEHPMLSDLVVLRQQIRDGQPVPVAVGRHRIWLEDDLGLRRA